MKKKVIIVGGGIAGLSAGVYALKSGFDVTILESHSIPGGNCTSWKRKGYLFEGGMHWLTGSGKEEQLNKLWRHVGALNDSVIIHNKDPYLEFDFKGTPIRFYRNVDTTQQHLTNLFPDDAEFIKKMCDGIRKSANDEIPDDDLFISSLKHEGLKELFRSFVGDYQGPMPIFFFFTFGTFAKGDGGFPEGGSLPFASRIAESVKNLGGEILYKTKAEQIVVENGEIKGVIICDQGGTLIKMDADAVIVASDTMNADKLFEFPLKSPWLDQMRKVTRPTMCTFVSLGINSDLRSFPVQYVFKSVTPINFANHKLEYIHVNNYADDPNFSPEGKTAMTVILGGDTYDFWSEKKENGTYEEEKQKLADEIIAAVEAQIPQAKNKVEVCDVATPLTYERYCGTWKGSYMTEMTPEVSMEPYPPVIEGIKGLYFAGQRMFPPGGFPIALITAKTAVEHLCQDTETHFVSED